MRQADIGPGLLDDVVQKSIAGLEQGKERIAHLAEGSGARVASVTHEIRVLQGERDAQTARVPGLEQQVLTLSARLDDVVRAGSPESSALKLLLEELTEAKVELSLAGERSRAIRRQIDSLEEQESELERMIQETGQFARELTASIAFLAANFRQIGSHLQSAQQSRALGLHVIRAQEEERRRLAREIHDGPTQLLNSVVLRIDVCQRFFDSDLPRLRDELQQLKELVRLSLQDVRKIIFDLRPMTLDDLGLIPALRTFLKDYQAKTGIETDLAVFGNERRYDSAFEVAMFRIVQEALTNVSKHAGASRVWVVVETAGGREVKMNIKDDGSGFDPDCVTPGVAGTRFGLVAMRERTELLGGSMEIQSAPGQGTKLSFFFPLAE